jgi:hypothetical protein
MEIYLIVLITGVAIVGIEVLLLLILAAGDVRKLTISWRILRCSLRDPSFADQVERMLQPAPVEPSKPSGVPLRLLALLQREGRLVDFFLEDIGQYDDPQVGAAVRDIHRQCQAALKEHLDLAPVLSQSEGASIEVPAGFDPSAVRLTGNVTGQPPFRGTLRHHGWRVEQIKLAEPPAGQDELVLMPAEVELP